MNQDIKIIIGISIFLAILIIISLITTYIFKNEKIKFLNLLLTILLILSNILAIKITVLFKLSLPCSILIYPLTFLCTISITELAGIKEAQKSIILAIVVQLIVGIILYITLVLFPDQIETIVKANELRSIIGSNLKEVFYPLLISSVSFLIAQLTAVGMYNFTKKYTFKTISAAFAFLFGTLIDTVLFTFINMNGSNTMINTLMNKFVANVFYTLVMILMFLIFTIKPKKTE